MPSLEPQHIRKREKSASSHWDTNHVTSIGSCTGATLSPWHHMQCPWASGAKMRPALSQPPKWTHWTQLTEHLSTVIIRSSYCQPQLYLSWGQKVKDTICCLKVFQLLKFITKELQRKKNWSCQLFPWNSAKNRQLLSYKESQGFAKICFID